MNALAIWLGNLAGAALAQAAPVIVGIIEEAIRRALKDTVEDGRADPTLVERLNQRLRDANRPGAGGPASPPGETNSGRGLGSG